MKLKSIARFSITVFCLLLGTAHADLALVGGTLLDGNGGPPLRDATLLIHGDRIQAIGTNLPLPTGTEILNVAGKWIMPGLIDAHAHIAGDATFYPEKIDQNDPASMKAWKAELDRYREELPYTFSRYLCSGVTAFVDAMGPSYNFETRELAGKISRAPRMITTGPSITTFYYDMFPHSDPWFTQVASPEQARAAVRLAALSHPDALKLMLVPGHPDSVEKLAPVIDAAIDETHRLRLRAFVHSQDLESSKAIARSGADVIMHSVFDKPIDGEFIELMKKNKIIYVPTLMVVQRTYQIMQYPPRPDLLDIEKECANPEVLESWNLVPKNTKPQPPRYDFAIARENLRRLSKAGVTIALGTDASNLGILNGASVHRELVEMVNAGLSPMQAILAATRNAAHVFSENPEIGTLATGKFADILILDANPLADIRNLGKISKVIKGGIPYSHASFLHERPAHQ